MQTNFTTNVFHWVADGVDRFVLPLGRAGRVILHTADFETWTATHSDRESRRVTLAAGVPLAVAQAFGEGFALAHGQPALVRVAAPWRSEPATGRQVQALVVAAIEFDRTVTKGQASDLLAAAAARAVAA